MKLQDQPATCADSPAVYANLRAAGANGGIRTVGVEPNAEHQAPGAWLADLFGVWNTRFSAEKARRILDWKPLVSLAEGQEKIREYLDALE